VAGGEVSSLPSQYWSPVVSLSTPLHSSSCASQRSMRATRYFSTATIGCLAFMASLLLMNLELLKRQQSAPIEVELANTVQAAVAAQSAPILSTSAPTTSPTPAPTSTPAPTPPPTQKKPDCIITKNNTGRFDRWGPPKCLAEFDIPPCTMRIKRRDWVIPLEDTEYHRPLLMTPRTAVVHDRSEVNGYTTVLARMCKLLPPEYLDRPFLTRIGDGPSEYPMILHKTEFFNGMQTIIVPYDWYRYIGPVQDLAQRSKREMAFEEKEPVAFWRGATTAYNWDPSGGLGPHPNLRKVLITKWGKSSSSMVDVGLSEVLQDAVQWKVCNHPDGLFSAAGGQTTDETPRSWQDHWQGYVKPHVKQAQQLKYRYLIAVEGNDFISGLAWMLFSQSVVIMPPPRVQNWIHELCLEPWVHYVPVKPDWSDLEEKIMTCEADHERCKKISQQATDYIKWHGETGYNTAIEMGAERMKVFFERVKLVIEED
jgi:hypothetical protein